MQIPLYKVLKSVRVPDENATSVVTSIEEHIAMRISEATKGLEAQLKSFEAQMGTQLKSLEAQMAAQSKSSEAQMATQLKSLEAQVAAQSKSSEAQMKSSDAQFRALTWVIGSLGTIIALATLAGTFAKFSH